MQTLDDYREDVITAACALVDEYNDRMFDAQRRSVCRRQLDRAVERLRKAEDRSVPDQASLTLTCT